MESYRTILMALEKLQNHFLEVIREKVELKKLAQELEHHVFNVPGRQTLLEMTLPFIKPRAQCWKVLPREGGVPQPAGPRQGRHESEASGATGASSSLRVTVMREKEHSWQPLSLPHIPQTPRNLKLPTSRMVFER
jgi:hypothetical protein